jgi:hypothetical protein
MITVINVPTFNTTVFVQQRRRADVCVTMTFNGLALKRQVYMTLMQLSRQDKIAAGRVKRDFNQRHEVVYTILKRYWCKCTLGRVPALM